MRVRKNAIELQLVMFADIRQICQPKKVSSNAPMLHQNALQYRTGWDTEAIFCIPSTAEIWLYVEMAVTVRTVDSTCTHARPIDEH